MQISAFVNNRNLKCHFITPSYHSSPVRCGSHAYRTHRGLKGRLGISCFKLLAQTPTAGHHGPCPDSFLISPGWETPRYLWATFFSAWSPSTVKEFSMFRQHCLSFMYCATGIVPVASCPVPGHSLKRACSVLFPPSCWVFIHTWWDPTQAVFSPG